jgi:hypothetical protein
MTERSSQRSPRFGRATGKPAAAGPDPYRGTEPVLDDYGEWSSPTGSFDASARTRRIFWAVTGFILCGDLAVWHSSAWVSVVQVVFVTGFTLAGLHLLHGAFGEWGHQRRLHGTAPRSIRDVKDGVAAIRGRIVVSPSGLLCEPSGARAAVWSQVEVTDINSEGIDLIARLTASRDFLVDDGSGELAYVSARGARVNTDGLRKRIVSRLHPQMLEVLETTIAGRQRGLSFLQWRPAEVDDYHLWEWSLRPGDEVFVVGASRRVAHVQQAGSEATASRLTFASGDYWADTLLIAAWPLPLQRASRVLGGLLLGSALVLLGAAPLIQAFHSWLVDHGLLHG